MIFDCVNQKINILITDLHESIEENKSSFKSCRRWKKHKYIPYSKRDRTDSLETLLNTRFNIIENSMNELLKTKVIIKYFCFYVYTYFEIKECIIQVALIKEPRDEYIKPRNPFLSYNT